MARPCARRRPSRPSRLEYFAVTVIAGAVAFGLIALVDTLATAIAWGYR